MDANARFKAKVTIVITKQDGTPFHDANLGYDNLGNDDVLALQGMGLEFINALHAYGKSKGIAAK